MKSHMLGFEINLHEHTLSFFFTILDNILDKGLSLQPAAT